MNKSIIFVISLFVISSLAFACAFFFYLYNQYQRAAINYYKKKINMRKYRVDARDRYNGNQIKNNITQILDHELIKGLVGYAVIEFFDEHERIIKTQTILKPSLSIGRDESNDVVLRGQTISRHQCVILYQNENFYICNLSSSNPTLLNGKTVENTTQIFYGDIIKISNFKLRLQAIADKIQVG